MSSDDYLKDLTYYRRFLDPKSLGRSGKQEEIRTTPLFSLAVKYAVDYDPNNNRPSKESPEVVNSDSTENAQVDGDHDGDESDESSDEEVLPEYALLGFHIGAHPEIGKQEPIFLNVNAPNSVFICGSQGSGKSYTLSVMLENCLLPDASIGDVGTPVAGVLFHYDIDAASSVAESAYLVSRGIQVNVLVSPSNEHALRAAYKKVADEAKNEIHVQALRFQSADLSIERIHKLMAFSEKEGSVPLYMEVAQRILREMAITSRGGPFDYALFKSKLKAECFSKDQTSPLNLRLDLLESFLDPCAFSDVNVKTSASAKASNKKASSAKPAFTLRPGTLTIIDLSDPFIDASTVCVLFDICLSIVKERRPARGLVVALDEAHKFMSRTSAAANFTERLLTTVREQRHNATRVLIATQEPTVSEKLLDLCSVSVVHRFTSPAWFAAIRDHLGGAAAVGKKGLGGKGMKSWNDEEGGEEEREGMFERIVDLQVGESLVFAPSAFLRKEKDGNVKRMGPLAVKMKTRMRDGVDGGKSVLALR